MGTRQVGYMQIVGPRGVVVFCKPCGVTFNSARALEFKSGLSQL